MSCPGLFQFTSCLCLAHSLYIVVLYSLLGSPTHMDNFELTAPLLEDLVNAVMNLSPQHTLALLISSGTSISSALVARKKARSAYRWFVIGFFLNVVGLALALIAPNRHTHARCPTCHGIVPIKAPSCMFCHTRFIQPKSFLEKLKAKLAV